MKGTGFGHCWDEYRDTLHAQKRVDAAGMTETGRWRATATASTFFTEQALIDAPLRTEFYKHLPGILTGIGIIGTFSGLILGLNGFKITDDPQVVRSSLESLVSSVGGAFSLSGLAIALAMVVTTIEKAMVNKLYTLLDRLCCDIDGLFESGAGEEYLQRLVEASETSATQAMQMKESLVTDLKQVLSELTQQQIAAITHTSTALGQSITTSLTEGLAEPLARISNAVQSVGDSQGEAVNRLLTDVLSSFTAQMENMFGSQLRGMNDMLLKTANTIETASHGFQALASQIQQAGAGAADAMAKRVEEALEHMQARQSESNEQMRAFVDQLKENVARGQAESTDLTKEMMRQLSESASSLVKGLQEQSHASHAEAAARQTEASEQMRAWIEEARASMVKGQSEAAEASTRVIGQFGDQAGELIESLRQQSASAQEEHGQRQAQLAAQIAGLLDEQTGQIAKVTEAVNRGSVAMLDAVNKLNTATHGNIERMGQGAERLHDASARLADNLRSMEAASDSVNGTTERLNQAAASLTSSLGSVQQVLADQRTVRDSLAGMLTELRAVVETASREASVKRDLVASMDHASKSMREAQGVTRQHLDDLVEDMSKVHGEFAEQIRRTLREGNSAFHTELAQATGILKGAISDLGDVFDRLPAAV
ncbi:anti-phage ZorAB system protein ZorA [Caballeronia calidae]|nr:anti-phage ZorAB system protein ZorA [Caballeronia calidae]